MNQLRHIQEKLRTALAGYVDDVDAAVALVRPTQDPKHGDYQANCAMPLAKQLKKKPRDIAREIVDRIDLGDSLHPPEIAGPGFINFRFQEVWLAKQVHELATDDRLGVAPVAKPQAVVIDFSSPNVAKPLHVGHIRSTIIGDSLVRLLRFLGHKVIGDNHLGDWGTQFGMVIYGYKHFLDEAALAKDPVQELARLYKEVRKLMSAEEKLPPGQPRPVTEASRLETAKLHEGDPENLRLWKMFMPWCTAEIDRIYQRLDIHFDVTHGESFYQDKLQGVVDELLKKGVAEKSEGAVVVFFGEKESPALVQKSDGAFTYMTSDLATIRYRLETWHADKMLYVVDFRQQLHFKQLFEIARRAGFEQAEYAHVSFGSILGEDKRPYKTREGNVFPLIDLLDSAVAEAKKVYLQNRQDRIERGEDVPDLSEQDLNELAEIVGLGAVKYADLCQNRNSDYVFSLPKMLAMDGNTATYMQYAYVRNRGIFRKGNIDAAKYRADPPPIQLPTDHERALALALLRFPEALATAAEDYQPSAVTSYLWDLAKAYSAFFVNCPVLKADTPELRESRLLLCDLTARVIQKGLELLGIKTAERM